MAGTPNFAKEQLQSIVARIERLEEEKQSLTDDIREVYSEAKGNGFDTAVLRKVIKLRKQDASERAEQEALLDLYMHALGMLADTPLGEAAVDRDMPWAKAAEQATTKPSRKKRVSKEDAFRDKVGTVLQDAVASTGKPVEVTDEERRKGVTLAVERPDGSRATVIGGKPYSPAAQAAADAGIGEGE